MKIFPRLAVVVLASLIICSALSPVMGVTAYAALSSYSGDIPLMTYATGPRSGENVERLKSGESALFDMTVDCAIIYAPLDFESLKDFRQLLSGDTLKDNAIRGAFMKDKSGNASNSSARVIFESYEAEYDRWNVTFEISNVKYNGGRTLYLKLPIEYSDMKSGVATPATYTFDLEIRLPDKYFTSPIIGGSNDSGSPGTGSVDTDDETALTSDIVIENVRAFDENGNLITDITKDTPPFSIEVIYTDLGLLEIYDDISSGDVSVFLIDAGSFVPQSSVRGTLTEIFSRDGDPPRFSATFNRLKYAGGTANYSEIHFRAQYDLYGYYVKGEAKARYYGVVPDESDEDKDDAAPPTPYIIISRYDLGADQIEAGSTFTLSIHFSNTSRDIPLENIRMVVNPVSTEQQQSFLTIASSTNTYYYELLEAEGGRSQSVDILVKGSATVGSQAVSLDFSYEYIVDKTRKEGTTSTTVYIPITQIDRFTVDPLTDYSAWMQVGDEGYATISFANLGKATTYNVSGYILDADGNQGQTEHFGNLEAGASGSLDFTIYPSIAGDYNGTIVIRYENENGEEKEVITDFTSYVEEPWHPDFSTPEFAEPEIPEEPGAPWWRYALFAMGGLAIAVPIALYISKRVKAKGSEDFDEDF